MIRRLSNRLTAWLLSRGTPPEWRESIAGDFAEARGGSIGLLGAVVLVVRLRLASRPHLSRAGGGGRRASLISGVVSDMRSAARGLAAHPGYATAVVATLAIGIGANVSVFSLANQWLLRPVPGVVDEDRLVTVTFGKDDETSTWFSAPAVAALRSAVPSLSRVSAYGETAVHVAASGRTPERLSAQVVDADFFEVLGATVALGRGFAADEYVNPGAPPAVVISDRLWRDALAASPDVLGRPIVIDGDSWTLVGVATPGFLGASRNAGADLWVPVGQFPRIWRWLTPGVDGSSVLSDPNDRVFAAVVGRLTPAATADDARGQVEAVRVRLAGEMPAHFQLNHFRFLVRSGLREGIWTESQLTRVSGLLSGIVVLLLILTGANVSSLVLAHTAGRRVELATRMALGASRAAVARLVLIETAALAAAAGAISIGIAVLAGAVLRGTVVLHGLPPMPALSIDRRVLGAALAVSAAAALLAGLVPAMTGGRAGLTGRLRRESRTHSESHRGWGRTLMAAQVAISLTLMVGSLLLARSMAARWAVDPGFDSSRVVTFSTDPATQGYDLARKRAFTATLLDRVRALPGVRAAAYAWPPPFANMRNESRFRPASGNGPEVTALTIGVSSDYFGALGMRLVEGRDFLPSEVLRGRTPGDRPVIITESLARALFGPGSAIGARMGGVAADAATDVVVGVVPDIRHLKIAEAPEPLVFEATPIGPGLPVTIVVGTDAPPAPLLARIPEIVAAIDPRLPIYDARSLEATIAADLSQETLVTRLAVVFAALATVLAAVGLYGVLARGVAHRRRELSIRVALGAGPATIVRLVASDAWRIGMAGVAIGLAATIWLSRYLDSWLFGVGRWDPLAIAGALALVGVMLVASAAGPARRAATIDCAGELK